LIFDKHFDFCPNIRLFSTMLEAIQRLEFIQNILMQLSLSYRGSQELKFNRITVIHQTARKNRLRRIWLFLLYFYKNKIMKISIYLCWATLIIRKYLRRVRISWTFSVLRPFSYFRPLLYFDLSTSTRLLRLLYLDLLSNLDFLLVETYRSKYSFGRSKEVEVKFGQKSRSTV